MKTQTTKPTQEEKATYMATHWGQKVLKATSMADSYISTFTGKVFKDQYLLLTPLSGITDEDLIYIGVMLDWFPLDDHGVHIVKDLNNLKKHLLNQAFDCDYYGLSVIVEAVDFLRSRSYAIRWRNYSVEQLISFGWLKLKQKGGNDGNV